MLRAKDTIEQEGYQLDSRDALLMTYYTSTLQLAIGRHESGKKLINETIVNAHKNQLFYQIDDMYRIGAYCAMIDHDFEQAEYMLKKLDQYRAFAGRDEVDALIFVIRAHYYNNYVHHYEQALLEVERFNQLKHEEFNKLDPNYIYFEKGKSLYLLGRYEEARIAFEHYTKIPSFISHPYDILSLNECFSYKALCYAHFGELTTAYEIAKMAYTDSLDLVDLPYKRKIEEVYRTIKAQIDSIT